MNARLICKRMYILFFMIFDLAIFPNDVCVRFICILKYGL